MAKQYKNPIFCKKCQTKTKHWDNTGTDEEQSIGKFVCTVCKTPYTPKPKNTGNSSPASTQSSYTKKDYGDGVPKSMYGAWANNLIIALIDKGKIKNLKEALETYAKVVKAYGKVLNKDVTPPPVEATPAETPEETPINESDLNLDIDELEL